MNSWGWGVGMKALESLEGGTAVKGKDFQFTGCEAECSQATEQLRCRVGGLNPQAGSRVTPVVSGHATGDDTVKGLGVAGNAAGDTGEIAKVNVNTWCAPSVASWSSLWGSTYNASQSGGCVDDQPVWQAGSLTSNYLLCMVK